MKPPSKLSITHPGLNCYSETIAIQRYNPIKML